MKPGIRAESRLLLGTRYRAAVVVVVVPKGRLFRSRVVLGIDYRGASLRRPYSEFFSWRDTALCNNSPSSGGSSSKDTEKESNKTPPGNDSTISLLSMTLARSPHSLLCYTNKATRVML